jgi:hypothetical protein
MVCIETHVNHVFINFKFFILFKINLFMFLVRFDVLLSKIIFLTKKNFILMHF